MPIYEYRCAVCGHLDEIMQKMSDPAPEACSVCRKGPMEKQMSRSNFALRGTGWYVTDFKGGNPPKSDIPSAPAEPNASPVAAPKEPVSTAPSKPAVESPPTKTKE